MRQLPSRLRRLDDALAHLPLDEPMLLTELDGFLTGIVVGPEPILPYEWMQNVWGLDDDGISPFDDPIDDQWFADAVMAQHDAIARDLERGKPQPILDVDDRNGDVLWEAWVEGFAEAVDLRPEGWHGWATGADADTADAVAQMMMLIAIARNESPLDSMEINAFQDQAPADIRATVQRLYAARRRGGGQPVVAAPAAQPKVGRNDPCSCGSGKKSKRCCG